ncbi:MAG TPA: chemotaxis protein CheW [Anaeromyxobacteraceae bacterium]|nr:chemotaxis protein CheW [Anaeromyxobacteraceae bacterium]
MNRPAPLRAAARSPGRSALTQDAGPPCELCVFRVGDEEYAIDLRRIREILQPLPVTPVPGAPEFIEGVMDLHGEVVPVVDVRERLGLALLPDGAKAKLLVVNVARRVLALRVDAVLEVVRLPRSAIGPPPPLLVAGGPRLFLGVCRGREQRAGARHGGLRPTSQRLRLLLDVKALLEPGAPSLATVTRRRRDPV